MCDPSFDQKYVYLSIYYNKKIPRNYGGLRKMAAGALRAAAAISFRI